VLPTWRLATFQTPRQPKVAKVTTGFPQILEFMEIMEFEKNAPRVMEIMEFGGQIVEFHLFIFFI